MICRGNSPIPIPISEMALGKPTWLNLCFVEKILRKSKGDNSIQVIDIFSKPATAKGDNYASDMTRITIEYTRDHEDRKITEKKSLIVKVLPMSEDIRSNLVSFVNIRVMNSCGACFCFFVPSAIRKCNFFPARNKNMTIDCRHDLLMI